MDVEDEDDAIAARLRQGNEGGDASEAKSDDDEDAPVTADPPPERERKEAHASASTADEEDPRDVLHVQARAYANQAQGYWWEQAFPVCFKYGRGGPSEKRKVKISHDRLFQHYLELSTGIFQHPWFVLHGYDVLARKAVGQQVFLQCRKKLEGFGSLTEEETLQAIQHAEACAKAARQGRRLPNPPESLSAGAAEFVQSLRLIPGKAKHSPAYVEQNRMKLYSMMYMFGTPQVWYVSFACICGFN
jgi:hypothetical protein